MICIGGIINYRPGAAKAMQQQTEQQISDEELMQRLREQPEMRARIVSLLSAVRDEHGQLKLADDAEERIVQEIRRLGHEAMQGWAQRQVQASEQEMHKAGRVHREGKQTLLAHHAGRRNGRRTPIPKG